MYSKHSQPTTEFDLKQIEPFFTDGRTDRTTYVTTHMTELSTRRAAVTIKFCSRKIYLQAPVRSPVSATSAQL